ncbi:MAG TPA: hypothetical protein VJS39_08680, partial [Gemmatimonadaceae bacterium]|nr:hypothetical protein [Gemmatimonadaceae bacterium]
MKFGRLFASARVDRSASLLIAFAVLVSCERAKSPPPADSTRPKPAVGGPVPESSPEAFASYAASHLPSGLKHGDFLTKKSDYPTGDTADVYRAVLDTLYTSASGSPGEVVLDDVAQTRIVTCTQMPCPLLPLFHQREVGLETMDAYREATLNRRHIRKFKYRLPLRLLSEEDMRGLEIEGQKIAAREANEGKSQNEHAFWIGFQAKYPRAWGMARLSTVGIAPDGKEALVEVSHMCGSSCSSTEVMYLWKVHGQWNVAERMPEAAETFDRGNPTLRFRGVGGGKPIAEVRIAAAADSIRKDKMPRDIHGTIWNPSGVPIAGAKLTLH